jgi:hypothetical protein
LELHIVLIDHNPSSLEQNSSLTVVLDNVATTTDDRCFVVGSKSTTTTRYYNLARSLDIGG